MMLILFILLAIGVPVAIALGFSGITGYIVFTSFPFDSLGGLFLQSIDSFPLMAIPFFMLAGNFMSRGLLARQLIDLAYWVFKPVTGSFGLAATSGSALFAAISGSSTATVVAMGRTISPKMMEKGYSDSYAGSVVAAGGTLGILIPPSLGLILLGIMMEYSISGLFMAGIIPGAILTVALGLVSYVSAKKKGYVGEKGYDLSHLMRMIVKSIPALMFPFIILGGIYSGWFTPTEAAAVSLFYAILVSLFIYKDIPLDEYLKIAGEGVMLSGMIFFIMVGAYIFSFVLTDLRIPETIVNGITSLNLPPIVVLIMFNVLLLVLGMFMESTSILILTVPIIWPVLSLLGFDPRHVAVMTVVNLEIGLLTPPVGMNLFAMAGVLKIPVEKLFKSIVPYIVGMVIVLIMIIIFPTLSTWLPDKLM